MEANRAPNRAPPSQAYVSQNIPRANQPREQVQSNPARGYHNRRPQSSRETTSTESRGEASGKICSKADLTRCIKKIQGELIAAGEWVTTMSIVQEVCETYEVSKFTDLHLGSPWNVPVLKKIMKLEERWVQYLNTYVSIHTICTLFEVQQAFLVDQQVGKWEDLKMGPILKCPSVKTFFNPAPGLEKVAAITTQFVVERLNEFTNQGQKAWGNRIEEFMEHLVTKAKLEDALELCVRIRNMSRYIKIIQEVRAGQIVKDKHILNEMENSAEARSRPKKRKKPTPVIVLDEPSEEEEAEAPPALPAISAPVSKRRLSIAGLPWEWEEENLKELCAQYGQISDLKLLRDSKTKISFGCGVVMFKKEEGAAKAKKMLNYKQIGDMVLNVAYAEYRADIDGESEEEDESGKGKDGKGKDGKTEAKTDTVEVVAGEGITLKKLPEEEVKKIILTVLRDAQQKSTNISWESVGNLEANVASRLGLKSISESGWSLLSFLNMSPDVLSILKETFPFMKKPSNRRVTRFIKKCLDCHPAEDNHEKVRLSVLKSCYQEFGKNVLEEKRLRMDIDKAEKIELERSPLIPSLAVICGGQVTESTFTDERLDAADAIERAPYLLELGQYLHWSQVFEKRWGPLIEYITSSSQLRPCAFLTVGLQVYRIDPKVTVQGFREVSFKAPPRLVAASLVGLLAKNGGHLPTELLLEHIKTGMIARLGKDSPDPNDCTQAFSWWISILHHIPHPLRNHLFASVLLPALKRLEGKETWKKMLNVVATRTFKSQAPLDTLYAMGINQGVLELTDKLVATLLSKDHEQFLEKKLQEEARAALAETESLDRSAWEETTSVSTTSTVDHRKKGKDVVVVSEAEESACSVVVTKIRREEFGIGAEMNAEAKVIVERLHQRTSRALLRLAQELYSNDAHFVLELVQNADDNSYPSNVKPSLEFRLTKDRICVLNNERGFSEKDIRALCDIGKSTKDPSNPRYIGQKGIGFKSVFRVTDAPEIHSKGFHIVFDAKNENHLGYILPTWLSEDNRVPTLPHLENGSNAVTRISLPIKKEFSDKMTSTAKGLQAQFEDIQPNLLLFLHRLKSICVFDEEHSRKREMTASLVRKWKIAETLNRVMKLVSTGAKGKRKAQTWILLQNSLKVPLEHRNAKRTQLSVGFPVIESDKEALETQKVFAFLPLRSFGFKFIINADFILPSSREDLDNSSPFNLWLLTEIPTLFVNALESFKRYYKKPVDAINAYLRFVPLSQEVLGVFKQVARDIISRLKQYPSILTASNKFVFPHEVVIPSSVFGEFSHFVDAKALQDKLGLHLIHPKVHLRGPLRKLFGVRALSSTHLVDYCDALLKKDRGMRTKKITIKWVVQWLLCLSKCIDKERSEASAFSEAAEVVDVIMAKLRPLAFIPLEDGSFTSLSEGSVYLPVKWKQRFGADYKLKGLRTIHPAAAQEDLKVFLQKILKLPTVTVRDVFEQIVVPKYQDPDLDAKNANQFSRILWFIRDHLRKMPNQLAKKVRNSGVVVETSNGLQVVGDSRCYYAEDYKNPLPLRKILSGLGLKWPLVSPNYLKLCKKVQEWQTLWKSLGITSLFKVETKSYSCEDISKTIWKGTDLKSPVEIKDHESSDLKAILEALTTTKEDEADEEESSKKKVDIARIVLRHLDTMFDIEYNKYVKAALSSKGKIKSEISSFSQLLRSTPWVPKSKEELSKSTELHVRCAGITGLLGGQVDYLDQKLVNKNFERALGIIREADLTPERIFEHLKKWAETGETGTLTKENLRKVYYYFIRDEEFMLSIEKKFLDTALVYCPSETEKKKFYKSKDLVWEDPTGILEHIGRIPVLGKIREYSTLGPFFLRIGVSSKPTLEQILPEMNSLSFSTKPQLLMKSGVSIIAIFEQLASSWDKVSDQVSEKLPVPRVPSHHNSWASPKTGRVFIVEGEVVKEELEAFKKNQGLHFIDFFTKGKKPIPKKVKEMLFVMGVRRFPAALEFSPQYLGESDNRELQRGTMLNIHRLLPYIQRLCYRERGAEYNNVELKGTKVPAVEFLSSLSLQLVEELYLIKSLFDIRAPRSPVSCMLEIKDIKKPILLVKETEEVDLKEVFVQLTSVLLCCKPTKVPNRFTNSLDLLILRLEIQKDDAQLGAALEKMKVKRLPEGEPIWGLKIPAEIEVEVVSAIAERRKRRREEAEEGELDPEDLVDPDQQRVKRPRLPPGARKAQEWLPGGEHTRYGHKRKFARAEVPEMYKGKKEIQVRPRAKRRLNEEGKKGQSRGKKGGGFEADGPKDKNSGPASVKIFDQPDEKEDEDATTDQKDRPPIDFSGPIVIEEGAVEDVKVSEKQKKKAKQWAAQEQNREQHNDAYSNTLGFQGEKTVYETLLQEWANRGIVRWMNEEAETGSPYDIMVSPQGEGESPKYVEVKTTNHQSKTYFEVSKKELAFAEAKGDSYIIYRVILSRENIKIVKLENPMKLWEQKFLTVGISL